MTQIILASASARRQKLLQQMAIQAMCCPTDIDETVQANEPAQSYCQRLALSKAQSGWHNSQQLLPVLGADTIVVLNPNLDREISMRAQPLNAPKKSAKSLITNQVDLVFANSLYTSMDCTLYCDSISGFGFNEKILGKPKDENDARTMLQQLSGRQHHVITAIAMVFQKQQKVLQSISTVQFATIPQHEIDSYIDSKEPMDKAGSYGIQGYAARWIKHISGSYSGIMGLPIYETMQLINQFCGNNE